MARFILPAALFAVLVIFLAVGLSLDPSRVPSPLIGKAAPEFRLPALKDSEGEFSNEDLKGQVSLLNVWATWCVACRQEHPQLVELARTNELPIYGLNYKDERDKALQWLDEFGDPYAANAYDADGQVGIDWGVYGAPETFVVDADGVIRYKHIGPLTDRDINETILPLVRELRNSRGTQG
jgi:cytochrome c biogenesis protein CcmG/thiol:disulfide interchange protein DsbE